MTFHISCTLMPACVAINEARVKRMRQTKRRWALASNETPPHGIGGCLGKDEKQGKQDALYEYEHYHEAAAEVPLGRVFRLFPCKAWPCR